MNTGQSLLSIGALLILSLTILRVNTRILSTVKENLNIHYARRLRMESINAKNKIVSYDFSKFAGRIGSNGLTFFKIINITISLSILFALIMLVLK